MCADVLQQSEHNTFFYVKILVEKSL